MFNANFNIHGLSNDQVVSSRKKYGTNRLINKKHSRLLEAFKNLAKEPMVILLLVTSSIYFLIGNTADGLFLAGAIILVSTISLYQESRSRNAMLKLKKFYSTVCQSNQGWAASGN